VQVFWSQKEEVKRGGAQLSLSKAMVGEEKGVLFSKPKDGGGQNLKVGNKRAHGKHLQNLGGN